MWRRLDNRKRPGLNEFYLSMPLVQRDARRPRPGPWPPTAGEQSAPPRGPPEIGATVSLAAGRLPVVLAAANPRPGAAGTIIFRVPVLLLLLGSHVASCKSGD